MEKKKKMKIKKRTEERKEGFPIKGRKEVKREKNQFSINERKKTKILQNQIATNIYSLEKDDGNKPMKSIPQQSNTSTSIMFCKCISCHLELPPIL